MAILAKKKFMKIYRNLEFYAKYGVWRQTRYLKIFVQLNLTRFHLI